VAFARRGVRVVTVAIFGTQPPRVWSKRDPMVPHDAVYVGRGTQWGNPFVMRSEAERDMVCDRFEREVLPTLNVAPLVGRHLICWCAPKRCHADALLRAAIAMETRQGGDAQQAPSRSDDSAGRQASPKKDHP
jgi:hypothetical protein